MKIEFLHKSEILERPTQLVTENKSGVYEVSGSEVRSTEAVIFFGGWGTGRELFSDCVFPKHTDVILCYDYRDLQFKDGILDFPYQMLSRYSALRLYAWSMGVYVASAFKIGLQKFKENTQGFHTVVSSSVAINGTEYPISNEYGIPEAIFKGTLEGMSTSPLESQCSLGSRDSLEGKSVRAYEGITNRTLTKFRRRMCGKNLEHFMAHVPQRTADELAEELQGLFDVVMEHGVLRSRWDAAICSAGDLIFPFASQKACWESLGVEVTVVDDAHYCPSVFEQCLSGKEL